jgi:hypothetical protein
MFWTSRTRALSRRRFTIGNCSGGPNRLPAADGDGSLFSENARSAETPVGASCLTSCRVWDIAAGSVYTWNTPFAKDSRDSGVSPVESRRSPRRCTRFRWRARV